MHFRRLHLTLLTLLLAASPLSAQVQKNAGNWSDWVTINPENEEFTVSMPKDPTTEAAKFPYHKMELNTRLYLATSTAGPVVAVASFSGIKSDPAQYTEFTRFNSYMDAFKDFFPPKVRTKDTAITKLTLIGSQTFHGYVGRSYKLSVGELNGTVHAFVTRKRFYAIVSLNTKKDDDLEKKFLSSFELPDRQPEAPKNARLGNESGQPNEPNVESQPASGDQNQAKPEGAGTGEGARTEETPNADPNASNNNQPPTSTQPNAKKGPISGGMLNAKAIYLPMPEMPAGAEASGVVLVAVLVDEQGMVLEARAVSGPPHLQQSAVAAARLARFSPTLLMGEPVRVSGTLSYNFVRAN